MAAEIDAATSRGPEPVLAEAATVEPANFSRAGPWATGSPADAAAAEAA